MHDIQCCVKNCTKSLVNWDAQLVASAMSLLWIYSGLVVKRAGFLRAKRATTSQVERRQWNNDELQARDFIAPNKHCSMFKNA